MAILSIVIVARKSRRAKQKRGSSIELRASITPEPEDFGELVIPYSDLTISKKIGEGTDN